MMPFMSGKLPKRRGYTQRKDLIEEVSMMKVDDMLTWKDITPSEFWDALRNQPAIDSDWKFRTFQYVTEREQKLYIIRVA